MNRNDGSSPRLRGTVFSVDSGVSLARFIPAPAGNRLSNSKQQPSNTVHPRACGEQGKAASINWLWSGSSPRLRGTGLDGPLRQRDGRFIPAPAGNSGATLEPHVFAAVHPRACGEQSYTLADLILITGSSPRLRGTVRHGAGEREARRFIPAPAGNSRSAPAACGSPPVHPRACGEQAGAGPAGPRSAGSSPRLRGTGHRDRGFRCGDRFIPAPAGNRDLWECDYNGRVGSSPRLRGTAVR